MTNKNEELVSIKSQLEKLLKSWETGDLSLIDECVHKQPFNYVSIFGKGYSPRDFRGWFSKETARNVKITIRILNHVALIDGDAAYQYAVVLGIYENNNNPSDHLAFGGSFANRLFKVNGEWMLETIRFDMQSDDGIKEIYLDREGKIHKTMGQGNRKLIDGWLTWDETVGDFMDKLPGTVLPQIVAEEDAPWYMTDKTNEDASDEIQIADVFYKYCFCNDFNSFKTFRDIFTEDAHVEMGPLGRMNLRDATAYLKELRRGAVRSYHCCRFLNINIEGATASADIEKYAPEAYSKNGEEFNFVQGRYRASFRKVNGSWKIENLVFVRGDK